MYEFFTLCPIVILSAAAIADITWRGYGYYKKYQLYRAVRKIQY